MIIDGIMIKEDKKYQSISSNMTFIIKQCNEEFGSEFSVFKNDVCFYENIQNNTQLCMEEALEEWGVSIDSWDEIEE